MTRRDRRDLVAEHRLELAVEQHHRLLGWVNVGRDGGFGIEDQVPDAKAIGALVAVDYLPPVHARVAL